MSSPQKTPSILFASQSCHFAFDPEGLVFDAAYFDIHLSFATMLVFPFANMFSSPQACLHLHPMLSARLPEGPPLRVQPDRCHTASLLLIFKTSQATEDHFIVSEGILLFFSCLHVCVLCRVLVCLLLAFASLAFAEWRLAQSDVLVQKHSVRCDGV